MERARFYHELRTTTIVSNGELKKCDILTHLFEVATRGHFNPLWCDDHYFHTSTPSNLKTLFKC